MTQYVDITGQIFGDWTVLRQEGRNRHGHLLWMCRCACGTERQVLAQHLKNGGSKGCGCTATRGVWKHGLRYAVFYKAWAEMIRRCSSPSCKSWPNYGGRGIKVFDGWLDPAVFWRDMGTTWAPGLTIERVDNDGNYEPGNCIWIPLGEQSRNRRPVSEWKAKPSGRPKRAAESAAHGAS